MESLTVVVGDGALPAWSALVGVDGLGVCRRPIANLYIYRKGSPGTGGEVPGITYGLAKVAVHV